MVAKRINTNKEWLIKPWTKLSATILGISSIFCVGYGVGCFKESLDWKIEKMKLIQEYNEKIQKQVDECRELKLKEFKLSTEELEKLAAELKKRFDEK